ncbi:MFS transporter [Nesterenkonia sp. Act20]|uniref:MFS transporter n=1 Tax=Nesterenkonia sp. Act20 TaxID=1483432 RepID=UPI001C461791|nr:MFS transporter [Nesterenkonia sp. Act20]
MTSAASPRTPGLVTLSIAVVLIGLTLRGPITGVPPLLSDIAAGLSLTPATAGLVTGLPLLAFALLSPLVPGLGRWIGVDKLILLSLLGLGLAIAVRPWLGSVGFLAATFLVGAAITLGNVFMPVMVRRDAGPYVPQVMAVSTAAYGLGQGLTAFLAVPLAAAAGWRWSISFPAVLVVFAVAAWIYHRSRVRAHREATSFTAPASGPPLAAASWRDAWTNPSAWWLALFFGMQALMFYTASTWTPDQLIQTGGLSQAEAGNALTIFHVLGIGGTLLVPYMARRVGSGQRLGLLIAVGWFGYFLGLFLLPEAWLLWVVIGGWVQGAGIGLAMTLIATRPADVHIARQVSGMVQCVGYSLAALGPLVVGGLSGLTGGWAAPTVALLLCAGTMAATAPRAASSEPIG